MKVEFLISVIVPVYNVEKYIKKCVNSILEQDYENFELILVDDGSTDKSGDICDEFANKDCRIKVIHKENGGLSDARNVAIDQINGEYIVFIDSDDYIEKNYLSTLLKLVEKYNVKISVCNFKYITETGNILNDVHDDGKIEIYSQKDAIKNLIKGCEINTSASMKMYHRSLFSDIRYPKGKLYEDISTTYKLFFEVDRIAYQNSSLYIYLCRTGSITKSIFTERRLDAITNMTQMCNAIKNRYPELTPICEARLFSQYIGTYGAALDGNADRIILRQLYDDIRKFKNTEHYSFKMKCYFWGSKLGQQFFNIIIEIEYAIQKIRKSIS